MTKSDGTGSKRELSVDQHDELIKVLKKRFEKNMDRHKGLKWTKVQPKLEANTEKLWSLNEMESTEGEPDVVDYIVLHDVITITDILIDHLKSITIICTVCSSHTS